MQGKTINGYTILSRIGEGGMAEVWLAENKIGKKAAVKFLADFCLTTPAMIRAKADGRTYGPILLHVGIHAALIGSCLLVYGTPCLLLLSLVLLELVSHFLIDTGKGHLTARFPKLADMQNKPYWMLYGFDRSNCILLP